MKILVALIAIATCVSCAAPDNRASTQSLINKETIPLDSQLSVKIAGDKQVKFLGYTDFDDAGSKGGQIMYPGGHAGVFLISVLTHSATVNSLKNSEKKQLQDKADKVLLPYRSRIDGISTDKLINAGIKGEHRLEKLSLTYSEQDKRQPDDWIIESSPVFFITQDHSNIILQNPVIIYQEKNAKKPLYRNLIEIVFRVPHDQQTVSYLNENDRLTDISSSLFFSSLKLGIQDAQHQLAQEATAQTFHYYLGKEKVFERGKLAHTDCERMTIRTLHGWLKAVPMPIESAGGNCMNATSGQAASEKI